MVWYPSDHVPQRAILYCRISDARNRDGDVGTIGVDDQERRLRLHFGEVLGWSILEVLIENDTSAFKRRKIQLPDGSFAMRVVRPKFRRALDLLAAGQADGFAALDLDRAMRDPRDLEDLIDLVEDNNAPVKSLTGSLSLDNDAGITMARIMVSIANKSSRDTSRRIKANAEAKALRGEWGGGPRPFGFESDGVTIRESEAELIKIGCELTLENVSIYSQVQQLRADGVQSSMGKEMSRQAWRGILMRARNCGLLIHNGEIVGGAPWPAIVDRDTWEAVKAKLTDRYVQQEPSVRRWYGTNIYLCARCGAPMTSGMSNPKRYKNTGAYRCSAQTHLHRAAQPLDDYVEDVMIARLSRPDAALLLRRTDSGIDVDALRGRVRNLRQIITEMTTDRALGRITQEEHLQGRDVAAREIGELEQKIAATMSSSPAARLIGADDVAAAWDAMALGVKRAVIRDVMTVTVHPTRRGRLPKGVRLDEDAIQIDWVPSPRRKSGVPHRPDRPVDE